MCWAPPLPEVSKNHYATANLFCKNATATGLRSFEPVGSCDIRLTQNITILTYSINKKLRLATLPNCQSGNLSIINE